MRPYRGDDRKLITRLSKKLSTSLKRHTSKELCGPCPICGGVDRFIVFLDGGNTWCRRCQHRGWWIDNPDEGRELMVLEMERSRKEQARLRAQMAQCRDWSEYHALALETVDARKE